MTAHRTSSRLGLAGDMEAGGGQMAGLACSHENSRFINQSVNMRSIFTIVLLAWITLVRGEEMAGPSHVTCGSVVKLRNSQNGRHLHSLGVNYGSGSGQQAVVGTHAGDSSESMWVVRDDGSTPCSQGTPIQSGFRLRLQHAQTGKWLHSHGHKSPLSGNQEVSCFGSNQQSDPGDIWVVELKETKVWEQDSPVLIKHESTGAYLGSGKKEYGNPISGYSEMYAAKGKGGEHMFMATDGVSLFLTKCSLTRPHAHSCSLVSSLIRSISVNICESHITQRDISASSQASLTQSGTSPLG